MPDTSFHTIVWKKTAAARPGSVLLLLHYIAYSINLEWLLSSASIPPCANLESPTVCIVCFAKTPTTKLHSIELLGIHSSRVGGTLYRNERRVCVLHKVARGKPVEGRRTKSESPFRSGSCDGTRRRRCRRRRRKAARATLGAAAIQVFFWCSATASRSIRWHCHTIIVVDCVLLEAKLVLTLHMQVCLEKINNYFVIDDSFFHLQEINAPV